MDQKSILNQLANPRSRLFSTFAPRDSQVELLLHEFDVTTCEIVTTNHEKNKHHQSENLAKNVTKKEGDTVFMPTHICDNSWSALIGKNLLFQLFQDNCNRQEIIEWRLTWQIGINLWIVKQHPSFFWCHNPFTLIRCHYYQLRSIATAHTVFLLLVDALLMLAFDWSWLCCLRHYRNEKKLGRVNFREDFWDC